MENLMHKHNAWGMDKDVWEALPEGTELRFKEVDSGEVYVIEYETARSVKIADQIEGFEMQYFFPLPAFTIKK